ncbi:MAG TPA: VCBS repeat-containing protein [Acidobacteriaceae bacterium]|nr:VCBS repeat-containing protein [Acidobacteriaceae bacterium]
MRLRDRRKLSCVIWMPACLACGPLAAQHQPTAPPRFTTVVIPTGGDPDALAIADVNHDGAPDIAAANPNSGTITVLLGDGKGQFHAAAGSPFPAGHLPTDIGVGDFNGDGHPDLLIPTIRHRTSPCCSAMERADSGPPPAHPSPPKLRRIPTEWLSVISAAPRSRSTP